MILKNLMCIQKKVLCKKKPGESLDPYDFAQNCKKKKKGQSLNAHNRKDILGPLEQGLNKGGFHNISPIFQREGFPLSLEGGVSPKS